MATWFPIWALRGELSSKNVLVEFQVSTSSASVKSQSPRIILVFLTVRSNCDYDHVWVCVHVLPCQVCVPREGCHELRVGPCTALVDLRQLYALILCADRTGRSSWECALTSMGGAKVRKSEVKRQIRSCPEVGVERYIRPDSKNQTWKINNVTDFLRQTTVQRKHEAEKQGCLFLNGICRRLHIWFVLQTIPLNNFATADPRTHFVSSSLQYPIIFSTSKPLSLFQLPLSLILCTSAAIFPALSLCETQLSVVQHSLGRPPKASDHSCMLLPTRVGSGGRPSVCYRLVPLSLLSFAQHWHHVPT